MTPDDAFLQAILDSPEDDTPRLVYADWLEEQGDPRAAVLRTDTCRQSVQLAASLKTATQSPDAEIEAHAAVGRIDVLAGLALLLERGESLIHNPAWPGIVASTREHLERVLALTPGAATVEVLLTSPSSAARDWTLASLLAASQPREVLLPLFERPALPDAHIELLACLAQEMVLRGADLVGVRAIERLQERLRAQGHPLAKLPLHLLNLEAELHLWLPRYGLSSSSWGSASEAGGEAYAPLPSNPLPGPEAVREVNDPDTADRIVAAVRNWQEQSNGQLESRVFHIEAPLGGEGISLRLLYSLGLDSLQGVAADDIQAELILPGRALEILFSAASTGGAYNHGVGGAYGRLAAWQSLAGLAGAAADAAIEEVIEMARRCTWVSFAPASEWFYQVAWDLALLAVRPDGQSLAVLAATDTD